MAGHETSATTLSWYWYLRSRHPDMPAPVQAESRSDATETVWIDSTLKESMRLYPAAWHVARRAVADDITDGLLIPAGEIVIISPYATQRCPKFWPQPDDFDPTRFHGKTIDRFAFLPFGGGPRICIGHLLAMLSLRRMIATMAQAFEFEPVSSIPPVPEALVTLGIKGSFAVNVRRTHAH